MFLLLLLFLLLISWNLVIMLGRSALDQIINGLCQFSPIFLPEPVITDCQLDPWQQIRVQF